MRLKFLVILLVILILGILLIAAKSYLPKALPSSPSLFEQTIKAASLKDTIKITISNSSSNLELSKQDGIWKTNNLPADQNKISQLLQSLQASGQANLVAQTDSQDNDFGVDSKDATKIQFGNLVVLVGKPSGNGSYLKFQNSTDVFLLDGLTPDLISTNIQDWYDKIITKIAPTSFKKLTFEQNGSSFSIDYDAAVWKINGKEVNETKLNPVILDLESLPAKSVASKSDILNYPSSPSLTLLIDYGSKEEKLDFYQGSQDYLITRVSDGESFMVDPSLVKDFLLNQSDLI